MPNIVRHPRMIMSSEGKEGSGKSKFGLSAPRAIRYLDFDFGVEGLDVDSTGIERIPYNLPMGVSLDSKEDRRIAQEAMHAFIEDFRWGLGKVRTIVADTFTAAWAGQRLANPKEERPYNEMEEEFKSLIRDAYACINTNVILIHHLRQDWARSQDGKPYKSQNWSRDGMEGVLNMVQLGIRQRYIPPVSVGQLHTPGRFELDVLKCRDNIGLVGTTHVNLDFPTLCMMACPTVDWTK